MFPLLPFFAELMRIPRPMRMSAPIHGRCLAMMHALAQEDLGDNGYQNRHEASRPSGDR